MPRRTIAALCAFFALLASSCDPKKPDATPTGTPTPVPGGTLVVSVGKLDSLDPVRSNYPTALSAVSQVFDSLTSIDPATNAVRPAAAARWSVSRDGLTWRFRLARATFHDGTPVRAADFKFAFDRLARKRTDSELAFQLEQVRGFRESHEENKATLAGVTAPSDTTLVVKLERPFAELPYALAHPALAPLPVRRYRRSIQSLRFAAIGNGPFKVAKASAVSGASLVRNETYAGTSPLLDGIEFRLARNTAEGWRAFLDGQVDVASVPASAVETARGQFGDAGFTPAWSNFSFGFNLKRPTYRSLEVRRAISLAIDREAIARTVYGNTRAPATGILPTGVRAFTPNACAFCVFDRERARRIISAAFGRRPPTITLDHLNERHSQTLAQAIASDLRAVGLRTRLSAHRFPEPYQTFLQDAKRDFVQLGWLADVPTPDGFLAQQLRTGSRNNHTGFSDSRFDRLIDQARKTTDESRRLRIYQAAERRALEQMPLVPIVFFRNNVAAGPRVRGFVLDGAGVFDGTTVWLTQR